MRVGIGRGGHEVSQRRIEAGAWRVEAGVGRAKIVEGLVAKLAAEGATDGVAAPDPEHITGDVKIATTEFGDAIANEGLLER